MTTLTNELRRLLALSEAADTDARICEGCEDDCGCGGESLPAAHRAAMIEVWTTLHGTMTSVPWDQRRSPLHDRIPEVDAWCVVKVEHVGLYDRSTERRKIWPGMAHTTRKRADGWRDFIADFYYDTHQRDGKVEWVVEYRSAPIIDLAHHDDDKIGDGYSDRSAWVGTLPMERWQRVRPAHGPARWRRKAANR